MRCNIARSIAGGGGSVVVGTYTGTGATQYITFDAAPSVVFIQKVNANIQAFVAQGKEFKVSNNVYAALNGNTLMVNAGYSFLSESGTTYNYVAFF